MQPGGGHTHETALPDLTINKQNDQTIKRSELSDTQKANADSDMMLLKRTALLLTESNS